MVRGSGSDGTKGPRRVGLVGCVKAKADRRLPAGDLYVSALFRGRRQYVKATCDEWWILSAEHGLVNPATLLDPYDTALSRASASERRRWGQIVLSAIDEQVCLAPGEVVEVHAGAEYRDYGLVHGLLDRAVSVVNPTAGMGIGRQLAFYQQQARGE